MAARPTNLFMSSQFKNASGALLTKALFYETTLADKGSVVYTLKREDHEGFPSLYRLYMASTILDPTEYTFATEHLDGWEHWEMLQECSWFKDYLSAWRREREVRDKALALRAILDTANDPTSKERFQANKFLLSWDNETKKRSRAGRPTKGEIKQEAERLALTARDIQADLERVKGLN